MQTQGCGWNGDEPCTITPPAPPVRVHKLVSQAPEAGPPPSLAVTVYTLDAVPQCVPCSNLGPRLLSQAPSKEWISASVDLVYAWMRAAVARGDVPYADGAYVPPDVWTRIYPTVNFCTDKFLINAISGTWTGTACAWSAAYADSLLIAMENRDQIKARLVWETANAVMLHHLHNWLMSDGQVVADCTAWVLKNNP
jgi:hypothetical protein